MNVGERLKHFREMNGLSQKAAAEKIGVNNYQLANYENNRSEPSIKTLKMMSRVYHVSIDSLVGNHFMRGERLSPGEEYVEADALTAKLNEILEYIKTNKQ